jgi:DNA topoisomerase-1
LPLVDPAQSAKQAGLRYVSDADPGIQRQPWGRGFTYFDPKGDRITDSAERERLQALPIPPSWSDVWICPDPKGHLQATGRDERGRKQYRYHPEWRKIRSQAKYDQMLAFGSALPAIRQQVRQDLQQAGLPRTKVIAAVVRLLDDTLIRIGNPEYVERNGSFGLTTLRDRHVDIAGSELRFEFQGKSGVHHEIELEDKRLAKIVKHCRDIPGYELFQYFDESGQRQTIDSGDVNDYLQRIAEQDFTAKAFRTWGGTVLAAQALQDMGAFQSETEAKKNITQAIKVVAEQLGNRAATCRKYYVHPAVMTAYKNDLLLPTMEQVTKKNKSKSSQSGKPDLYPEEKGVIQLIQDAESA